MLTQISRRRRVAALLALATALTVAAPVVEARPGGGGSMGSRGSRTFNAPSATPTAPGGGMTMQRSQTAPSPGMGSPGMQAPAQGRRFGGGFFAGLLGAGLIGALLGGGFFGGLGGLASMIGLLFQVGLVVFVVMLALRFFRRRNEPAGAGALYARSSLDGQQGPAGPMGGAPGGAGMFGGQRPPQTRPVQIGPNDYQAFERLLGDIQEAYSREDRVTLANLSTPEMVSYFDEELRNNASRGVVNKISDVKLLQGDLAEAWAEDRTEYATVAMRYALKDVMVERASGRIVQTDSSEATELWTFQRQPGRGWVLSAIQQTR
ncbi:Predicted lipid-binding transport protein, Tim44 family [Methylobacterium phyllostachyos]|uniref:Predicted lipid-binding transport protein, Tim44 family n=1 Tax=Methylobacterium phyllostachyos TaxID=582672 RepID=A0A1G9TN84_9HYPH|nr:TIM44-like domain-containing protein [Methylobacterium phyllostachyos]SDM48884.1 Predicted lipid-binding transport protein, Tim44 family [Methylobacterium phyllostachyos]